MVKNVRRMTLSDMFNDSEAKEIENYCNAVFDGLRKANAIERVQSPYMDGRQVNLQGLAAEIWFKKKHKIPYDLSIIDDKPRSYLNDIDVKVNGKIFELKQTAYENGCLFLRHVDWYGKPMKFIADVYVLIIGSFPNYKNDLFITREEFVSLNQKPRMHKRIGKYGFFVEQSDMHETIEEAMQYNVIRNSEVSPTMS